MPRLVKTKVGCDVRGVIAERATPWPGNTRGDPRCKSLAVTDCVKAVEAMADRVGAHSVDFVFEARAQLQARTRHWVKEVLDV